MAIITNSTRELLEEIENISRMFCPKTESIKLQSRLEELLSNYNIDKKTINQKEEDLKEKIELFISAIKLEGFSVTTLSDYRLELNLFGLNINKCVEQITTSDIRMYLSSRENIMASTLGKKLFILRSFFGWLVREEYLLKNPTLRISPPKKPTRERKSLTIQELEKVRESCKTLRQRCLIEITYSTAGRLSEIVGMNISDINFNDCSVNVIGKGNKERTVFISAKAMYHLEKYLSTRSDNCDSLFVTQRKPFRRMSCDAIQREIRIVEELSNIKSKLTMHILRHTFATLSMENGIELADLQSILGHENPSTTLVYAQVSESRKKQAHKRFHVQ